MKKPAKILLILIAVVCFGVALYYPVSEYIQKQETESADDWYAAMMEAGRQKAAAVTQTVPAESEEASTPEAASEPTSVPEAVTSETGSTPETDVTVTSAPAAEPANAESDAAEAAQTSAPAAIGEQAPVATVAQQGSDIPVIEPDDGSTPAVTPSPTPDPTATPDRRVNNGAKIWADLEKIALNEDEILPQYQELYAVNNDMVGWLTVLTDGKKASKINYPVMQTEDDTYYLSRDFMRKDNANGLLILDSHCDPYTPSYNLVVSGHNRKNDTMFSNLYEYYNNKRNWGVHKYIQFDSLMEERTYVVFAAFFSADYDVDEEGFRYNADIQYSVDLNLWVAEVEKYRLYNTGIDVQFGDEILTLTTCNSSKRKNGRFVVVCRRLREGEEME